MYNLPKFDSEKAAKNLNKTYKTQCLRVHCPCFKNVVKAISMEGQTGLHTLRVIMEGVDKLVFQMIWIAGCITTNGVHVACNRDACHPFYWLKLIA